MSEDSLHETAAPAGRCPAAQVLPPVLLVGVSVLAVVDARGAGHLGAAIKQYVDWTAAHVPWSLVLYEIVTIVALMLSLPLSLFVAAAGALFGAVFGYAGGLVLSTTAMTFADTCAGVLSLLLGRSLLREAMERKLHSDDRFRAIRAVIGLMRSRGVEMTAVIKMAPLPSGLLSYMLGCTPVSVLDFTLGTALVTVPYVALTCFVSTSAVRYDDFRKALFGSPWAAAATCAVAVCLGALAATFAMRMRRLYQELLAQEEGVDSKSALAREGTSSDASRSDSCSSDSDSE